MSRHNLFQYLVDENIRSGRNGEFVKFTFRIKSSFKISFSFQEARVSSEHFLEFLDQIVPDVFNIGILIHYFIVTL